MIQSTDRHFYRIHSINAWCVTKCNLLLTDGCCAEGAEADPVQLKETIYNCFLLIIIDCVFVVVKHFIVWKWKIKMFFSFEFIFLFFFSSGVLQMKSDRTKHTITIIINKYNFICWRAPFSRWQGKSHANYFNFNFH